MHSLRLIIWAAVLLTAGSSLQAQEPVRNLQDLVGARGRDGEYQMQQRGYRFRRTEKSGGDVYNYFTDSRSNRCVTVHVADGRYQSIVYVPNSDCEGSYSSRSYDGSRGYGNFRIFSARYGTAGNYRDVESALQRVSSNDGVNIQVNNQTMGGDPVPGREKELIVDYEYRGRRQTASVREGDTLNIGRSGGGSDNDYGGGRDNWGRYGSENFQILSATYGARGQNQNVEYILRRAASYDGLSIPVNNQTMEGDPIPGTEKELVVRYRLNGRNSEARVREGETLNLGRSDDGGSNWSGDLRIISAEYGASGRHQNVSSRLRDMVQNDRLRVKVTNENMGGDPAVGADKKLRVVYRYRGKQREKEEDEGHTLEIP